MSLKQLSDKDFVFNKSNNGKITSLGYDINSFLLDSEMAGGSNLHGSLLHGNNNIMTLFKGLSVPAGLANFNHKYNKVGGSSLKIVNNDKVIDDDLHDKLINMVEFTSSSSSKKHKKTQKHRHKENNNQKTKYKR